MILTKNEVIPTLEQYNKAYLQDEFFRQSFAGTSLAEQTDLANLEYDYSQAINQAYATSMKTADAIAGSALGTGYKEQALAANQDALLDAFVQYKQNYNSDRQSIVSSYDDINQSIYNSYLEQEDRISKQAETFMEYWDEHYNYAEWLWNQGKQDLFNNVELHNFVTLDEYGAPRLKTKSELFNMSGDNPFVNEKGELTDSGRHYLDVVEGIQLEGAPTFGEYLAEQNRKLWDWATEVSPEYGMSGVGLFKEVTGRGGNYEFKYSPYDYRINDIVSKWDTDYVPITRDNLIDATYLDEDGLATLESDNWKLSSDAQGSLSPEKFKENAKTITAEHSGGNSRTKVIRDVADAAMAGTLKEGTIIDINVGNGTELWTYWNNKFYKLQSPEKQGYFSTADGSYYMSDGKYYFVKDGKPKEITEQSYKNGRTKYEQEQQLYNRLL